jgi:hypothetical protein
MPDGIGQREAISQSGKQHVPGSWQLARAGKQQGAQRRNSGGPSVAQYTARREQLAMANAQ